MSLLIYIFTSCNLNFVIYNKFFGYQNCKYVQSMTKISQSDKKKLEDD